MKKILLTTILFLFFVSSIGIVYFYKFNPMEYPNIYTSIEKDTGYFFLSGPLSTAAYFVDAIKFFDEKNIKKVVVEIHSPGGYLHAAQRIVGYMNWYKERMEFETRTFSMASSAGFLIFINGDKRYMSETAYLMWHKIKSVKPVYPPDPVEAMSDEILQDWADRYIASKGKVLQDRVSEEIEDDLWMLFADDAIRLGFADGYIDWTLRRDK